MLRIQTDTPTAPKGYNLNSPAMDQATGVSQHALQAEITALQATNRPKLKLILLAEFLCIVVGGGLAWLLTPWLQTLAPLIDRQFGAVPEVFRDVSRASGLAAYSLLWISMVFGVLISGRMSRVWPGGPEAFELHRFCSVLALGFTLLHVLVLLGDPRLGGNPVSLLAIGALSARAPLGLARTACALRPGNRNSQLLCAPLDRQEDLEAASHGYVSSLFYRARPFNRRNNRQFVAPAGMVLYRHHSSAGDADPLPVGDCGDCETQTTQKSCVSRTTVSLPLRPRTFSTIFCECIPHLVLRPDFSYNYPMLNRS